MARMNLARAVEMFDKQYAFDASDFSLAWGIIRANIKKARPTVRRKPPVQQPQANITVFTTDVVTSINKDDPSQIDCDFTIFKRP